MPFVRGSAFRCPRTLKHNCKFNKHILPRKSKEKKLCTETKRGHLFGFDKFFFFYCAYLSKMFFFTDFIIHIDKCTWIRKAVSDIPLVKDVTFLLYVIMFKNRQLNVLGLYSSSVQVMYALYKFHDRTRKTNTISITCSIHSTNLPILII